MVPEDRQVGSFLILFKAPLGRVDTGGGGGRGAGDIWGYLG